MSDFSGEGYSTSPSFAQLSYFAAANLVNAHRYQEAIPYLKAYIHSGEDKYRKTVFVNLIKACAQSRDYTGGIEVLDEAIANYPSDYNILSSAVNFCIDNQDNVNLQRYVAKALAVRPNDETLLNIQGKSSRTAGITRRRLVSIPLCRKRTLVRLMSLSTWLSIIII